MGAVSAEELLALAACNEVTLDIEGVGKLTVRPLSYADGIRLGQLTEQGALRDKAVFVLTRALVEPALTDEQAGAFYDTVAFGLVNGVVNAILRVSGMLGDDTREVLKSVGAGPAAGDG